MQWHDTLYWKKRLLPGLFKKRGMKKKGVDICEKAQ